MLWNKPKLTYCGLTVVLSKPSRFDNTSLLSANGGMLFNEYCLQPHGINMWQCDIRLKENKEPLLPNTKCILLMGQEAAHEWLPVTKENTLNEIRGAPYTYDGRCAIATYAAQDAADIKNYEAGISGDEDNDVDEEGSEAEFKTRKNKTQRKNFRFWLCRDTERAIRIIKNGGEIPCRPYEPEYIVYPPSHVIIDKLTNTKGKHIFFDIETDENNHILCFSFSFGMGQSIYCVPVLDHTYSWAYSTLPQIFRALAISIRDNILVAHNGANYDFFWLGYHYHIPIYKVEDTMLMHHRCFPSVEKSLGHCMSTWTYEPYHKDEGQSGYSNSQQVKQKLLYCGKDVFGMVLVHSELWKYAARVPGLSDSFRQVNDSIKPYLLITFTGIEYDNQLVEDIKKENDRLMMQYIRIINLLIGENTYKALGRRYKSSMPSSNVQCVEYFHNLLGYKIAGWGKPSKIDGKRKPSLAKKNIFKLRLIHDNPVIDFIIAFRAAQKETGSLKFIPWSFRDNATNNTTTNNHT